MFDILIFSVSALVLLCCIYIYINPGPNVKQSDATAWLKDTPIAHRGLHTNDEVAPENSLEAFSRAMRRGYAIELDVHLSLDGEVIVSHDRNLQRMTGFDHGINVITWERIQKLKLLESDESIPLLKDVLFLIGGQVPLLIEVKNEGPVGKLENAIIEDLSNYKGEFAIQSFNPFVLKYIKKHAPNFVRGQLAGSFKGEILAFYKKFLLRYLILNNVSSPLFVAYEMDAIPKWMANRLRKKGLYLLAWTVRSPEVYERVKKDYDNVIFEGFEV